jgi:hypothetical protein
MADEPEMISTDEALQWLRAPLTDDEIEDDAYVREGRDYKDACDLWSRPLLTTYERARRILFLRTHICDHPRLTRIFFAVDRPVDRVVWEVQHRYLMHTLKGIALEDYRVFIEDYEHWMSGSWESYMGERGYL